MDINTVIEECAKARAFGALHYLQREVYQMRMRDKYWATLSDEEKEHFLTEAKATVREVFDASRG